MTSLRAALLLSSILPAANWAPLAQPVPSVPVVRHDGATVPFSAELPASGVVAIHFIFTNCKIFCPVAAHAFARVQKNMLDEPVQLLSISVDPDHDSPAALSTFARDAGGRPGQRWTLLTGDKANLAAVVSLFEGMTGPPRNHSRGVIVWHGPSRSWTWLPESNSAAAIEAVLREALARPKAVPVK